MSGWSLPILLSSLHEDIERRLAHARKSFAHPGTKGDASEGIWRELLSTYLPTRYQVETAHIVDSDGTFSEQIDAVVFDRQYSPFVFNFEGQLIIPAESVYAVFEAKQTMDAALIEYAQKKVASVRALKRTSLPIPHAGGTYPPKPVPHILGGLLSLESTWNPPLGDPFVTAMAKGGDGARLDIGCCASHGAYWRGADGALVVSPGGKPATAFLLELIAHLQATATVPMIDVRAYASWLGK